MRTIAISEEDYAFLKNLRRKFGTFANVLSHLLEKLKMVVKELAAAKREIKTLKKELKLKEKVISDTLTSVVAQKTVQFIPLTPPPTASQTYQQPITDAMYPKPKIKPIKVLTQQQQAEIAITSEFKTKLEKMADKSIINKRLICPSDLQDNPASQEK